MKVKELVGRQIQIARKRKGLTQEEVAERIGITPKYLSSIERGQANPTLDLIMNLAESIKVPVGDFFDVAEEMKDRPELIRRLTTLTQKASDETLRTTLKVLGFFDRSLGGVSGRKE